MYQLVLKAITNLLEVETNAVAISHDNQATTTKRSSPAFLSQKETVSDK